MIGDDETLAAEGVAARPSDPGRRARASVGARQEAVDGMRIAIVNQHPRDVTGGSELQCDLVARALVRRGHAVRYVAVGARHSAAVGERLDGLPYEAVRTGTDPEAIVTLCRSHRADVIYWRMNRPGLGAVARTAAAHAIPLVLATAHVDDVSRWPMWDATLRSGPRPLVAELRRVVQHRRTWSALRHVAGVAAQREDFLGRTPVRRERLVRNVFDASLLEQVVDDAWAWPRPYVAWVGNVKPRKRPEELQRLAGPLAEHGVDLLVVGALVDVRYQDLFGSGAAGPNVHALGGRRLDEVLAIVAGARALIVTAREEGFSNVLVQAWWQGIPVVSLGYDPDGLIARHGLGVVCGENRAVFREAVVAAGRSRGGHDPAAIASFARETFGVDENLDALEALFRDVIAAGVSRPAA